MKTTRQHLQKLIKEELDAVMKETEEGLEEVLDDRKRNQPFVKGPKGAPDKESDPARRAYRDGVESDERKKFTQGVEADAKKKDGRLGEIKGAMGANMADFDRSVVDGDLDIPGTGARQAIRNVAFSADNRDEPDDDYYADDDQIGPGTKDEEIDGMLERMGIDSTSQEGMDLRMAIKDAAQKFSARSAERRVGADPLAAKSNFPPEFKKDGKLTKASTSFQKNLAKRSLGLGEAEELEEVKSDREQQGGADKLAHDKAKKGIMKQDLADKEKGTKDKNPVASKKRPLGGEPNLTGKDGKYNNPVKSAYGTAKGKGLVAEAELDEAEELEEAQEMEQISESFRRFTKILKG